MGALQDFRAKHPAYDDMDDAALSDALYRKFYSDMPRADFDAKMGLQAVPPAAEAEPAFGSNVTRDDAGQRYVDGVPVGGVALEVGDPMRRRPPAPAPEGSGLALNTTAGLNEGLYSTLGAPVDLMRGTMNLGVRGFNYATGSDVPLIPDDSFGGSRSIANTMGAIDPVLDPANTVAATPEERMTRAAGQGIAGTMLPAGLVGGAARAGLLSEQAAATGAQMFGRSNSVRSAAADAFAGGAAGIGGAQVAEMTPEEYRSLGSFAGGLVGGGIGSLATGLPALAREGGRLVGRYAEPFTATGRERMVGRQLRDASSDAGGLRDRLDAVPFDLVPGSKPTTGQATGDMGLLALERGSQAKYPAEFGQRRADQNQARVGSLEAIQPKGAAEAVTKAIRSHLGAIDDDMARAYSAAQGEAQARVRALGPGLLPDEAGAALRGSLESARATAKRQEQALWDAVDPDGSVVIGPQETRKQTADMLAKLPRTAKPPEGDEAAIYSSIQGLRVAEPFSALTALRARVNDALKAERRANGESQAYRRLSMTRGAIEQDFERMVRGRVSREDVDVRQGRIRPEDTLAARIGAVGAPNVGDAVFTAGGRRVGVRYELAEGDTLRTSNTLDGRADPAYPAGMQPRDRSRAASDAQIAGIARGMQPERLGASTSSAEGAPIVGPDGVVESGNGRTLGIRQAFREKGESARAYLDFLTGQGYDTTGFREPVLIRRRVTDMTPAERMRFAQEANASSSLSMSASEQAASDASRLTGDTLGLFRGGDLGSAENREFTRAFLRTVPDKGQEGSFVTRDGSLSLDGARRMQNALLHSAYRDTPLVASLADEGDENIRAFGRALGDLSGDVARLRAGIDAGRIDPGADISRSLVEAARVVQGARARGVRLADAVSQQDAFSRVSPDALDVLQIAYGPTLSGRLSREKLGGIMRSVLAEAEQQTADARLFGGALDAHTILEGARVRYGNATVSAGGRGGSVARSFDDRASGGGLRPREGGSGNLPAGQKDLARGGRYEGESVLARPELVPNYDAATQGRLRAATDASRERGQTFDNKTLGPLRRRVSSSAAYDVPDASVAARLFSGRPESFEAVGQYRRAVGDEAARAALEPYAVDQLRRAALKDDGTFDPGRLARWRQTHRDALRAFPDLDARFADAGRAAETMADVAAANRARTQDAQAGAVGRLMGLDDPADITRTIGGMFSAQDANNRFAQIRRAIGSDADGREGLRRAVVDHIMTNFLSNTEAGTSGLGTVKSDAFQTFVKKNRGALSIAGFGDADIATMQAVAADLSRANRSNAAVRNPGSNTAQDRFAIEKGDTGTSMLAKAIGSMAKPAGAAGAGVGLYTGSLAASAAGVGTVMLAALRENGIRNADELLRDALLHPERAKALLMKVPPKDARYEVGIAKRYRATVAATGGMALGTDERRKHAADKR